MIRAFGEKKPDWEDDIEEIRLVETFTEFFQLIADPRQAAKTQYRLMDILFIAVCAYICGANSWTGILEFSKARKAWLEEVIELEALPSRITYWRVFSALDPDAFQNCFFAWIKGAFGWEKGSIALDGKELRGFHDKDGNPLTMVSAWATDRGLLLGQVPTDSKSNEITAIPMLLDMLAIKDCVVSIDAIGCQTEIARKIIDKEGDYLFSLKGNQGTLKEDVELFFQGAEKSGWKDIPYEQVRSLEKGHGRIETREVYIVRDIDWLEQKVKWPNLAAIIMVKASRERKGKTSEETRFYITSSSLEIEKLAAHIRGHWGIENGLHWSLDVGFREDRQVARNRVLARNLAVLRRVAFNHLKQEPASKLSIENKRFRAAIDLEYLEHVLAMNYPKKS